MGALKSNQINLLITSLTSDYINQISPYIIWNDVGILLNIQAHIWVTFPCAFSNKVNKNTQKCIYCFISWLAHSSMYNWQKPLALLHSLRRLQLQYQHLPHQLQGLVDHWFPTNRNREKKCFRVPNFAESVSDHDSTRSWISESWPKFGPDPRSPDPWSNRNHLPEVPIQPSNNKWYS